MNNCLICRFVTVICVISRQTIRFLSVLAELYYTIKVVLSWMCFLIGDLDAAVSYWVDIANYDLETAKAMLMTGRYLYVGFMCHQTIEKILKAYYVRKLNDIPPYTHNLSRLANLSSIYEELNESQKDFLDILEPLNIEARYPTYKDMILKSLTKEKCELLISKTEGLSKWIESQL